MSRAYFCIDFAMLAAPLVQPRLFTCMLWSGASAARLTQHPHSRRIENIVGLRNLQRVHGTRIFIEGWVPGDVRSITPQPEDAQTCHFATVPKLSAISDVLQAQCELQCTMIGFSEALTELSRIITWEQ